MARFSFLHHAAIYGGGNLLVSLGGFLLVPLYVRCLDRSEYGTLELYSRLGEILLLCLLYNGLRQALISFHNQATDPATRQSIVGSTLLFTFLLLGIGGICFFAFAPVVCHYLDLGTPNLLRLATLSIILESFFLLLLALAQARVESLKFSIVNLTQFLFRVILCILFVPILGFGLSGILLASCLSTGLFTLYLLLSELRRSRLTVSRRHMIDIAWFSLPFVPGGLGFFLLNSGDRFFLLHSGTSADVGIYALGYKLALAVKLLSRRPLYMVWSARMYDVAKLPEAPTTFGVIFSRILSAYVATGLALCLVQDEVISFIAGAPYAASASIIAPVVLAYFFLSAADLMDAGFYIQRRTMWKTPITFVSTITVFFLYWILIPVYGMMGAAISTALGFLAHSLLTYIVSQRIFPVRYEWDRVLTVLLSAILFWLFSRLLPSHWWMIPIKGLLWCSWLLVLWQIGTVSPEEKYWLKELAKNLIVRFRFRSRRLSRPARSLSPSNLLSSGKTA